MTEKILKNSYYQISVEMHDGFKFKVPARGFNLKSLLEFEKSLDYVTKYSYKEITLREYEKLIYGKPDSKPNRRIN
jgi:hypothetical protein